MMRSTQLSVRARDSSPRDACYADHHMAQDPHKIEFEALEGWDRLPEGYAYVEVAGVACDSRERVYVFGSSGDMTVLDPASGKVFWTQNLLQKYGGSNINWGLSESPLVLTDRILVTPGGRGASIVALRKTDGSLIWKSQSDEPGYSSALLHPVGSVQQAIVFTAEAAGSPLTCMTTAMAATDDPRRANQPRAPYAAL